MKKLKTTTASTLLMSITAACGAEEQGTQSKTAKVEPEQNLPSKAEQQKFNFKIGEIKDSVNAERCRARCVIADQ
jgi:hypothetical protein